MERTRSKTLKLFVVSDIGRRSSPSLPHDQHNRGNFPRQCQACHLRSHPFGEQSRVKLLERTGFNGSDGGGTLKQILQIVVAVSIESANRDLLPDFCSSPFTER